MFKKLFTSFLVLFILSGCKDERVEIRRSIITKATTEMELIIDKAINLQTAGLGSLVIDNIISPEKKKEMIEENLLPRFKDFVSQTESIDSLKDMDNDEMFRYKMILKSTVGNSSEDALKALYEKIISGDFKMNIK